MKAPLIRAAAAVERLYGPTAQVRSKMVQHPHEEPRLQWWVDAGRNGVAIAADSLEGLVAELERRVPREGQVTAAPEKLLDSKQAAAYLGGVHSGTVTHWAQQGQLKSTQVDGHSSTGKQYRFRRDDLDAFAKSHKIVHRRSPKAAKARPSSNGSIGSAKLAARVKALAARLSNNVAGIAVTVSYEAVAEAALARGLDELEKQIR